MPETRRRHPARVIKTWQRFNLPINLSVPESVSTSYPMLPSQDRFDDLQIRETPTSSVCGVRLILNDAMRPSPPTTSWTDRSTSLPAVNVDAEMALLLGYYAKSKPSTRRQISVADSHGCCETNLPAPSRFRRDKRKPLARISACK